MNEAQKMATAIRKMMAYEKDTLVDMLICLAAVAPVGFLSDVAERERNDSLKPGPDTTGETPERRTKVLVPAVSDNYGGRPPVESEWSDKEIAEITEAHCHGQRRIHAIKHIRALKGLGLADAKFTLERMEAMGLIK
jgi:hypothetical protein